MNTRTRSVLAMLAALAMLLTACSSDGDVTAGGYGSSSSEHSSGIPIQRGEWPFPTSERCEDPRAPGCLVISEEGRTVTGLAAAGSTYSSSEDITVTYRGAVVIRSPGPDSANPESRRIYAFFDLTFPRNAPADGLRALRFTSDSAEQLSWSPSYLGGSHVEKVWPNSTGVYGTLSYQPEPGETLTVAYAARGSGPTSLLGEHDPLIMLGSNYASGISSSAWFAVFDQDPDSDVLDDVLATIEKVAASSPDATGGRDDFENVFGDYLSGMSELVSVNELDSAGSEHLVEGDGQAEVEPTDGPEPPATAPVPPPPPPPPPAGDSAGEGSAARLGLYEVGFSDGVSDFESGSAWDPISKDPNPDVPDYYSGYEHGWEAASHREANVGSTDTGRDYVQPAYEEDPMEAARTIISELGVAPHVFIDCDIAMPAEPCINIGRRTHMAGVDHHAYVEVRLTPKDWASEFDFVFTMTAYEPLVDGWIVEREWTVGDGGTPSWVW